MTTKRTKELITLTLENAIEQYLLTLATEAKNPRYITWLKERLGYFTIFMHKTRGENYTFQDMTIENGREFIRELMERDVKYRHHPLIKPKKRKLTIQYIHS
jgi:hypothetical protein